jgi:hypothetical protein
VAFVACLFVVSWTSTTPSLVRGQDKKAADKGESSVKPANEELRQELLRRVKEDQDARKKYIELMTQQPGGVPEAVKKKMEEIDRTNTKRLKEIVDQHGWPGKSLVGEDGAQAAWLLIQHADLDRPFQKKCLELLRAAFKKGEVTGQQVAYLTDRVLVGENKKQLYGTQFQERDGKWAPFPIEDEANVDKRRKEVGLSTLAEYEKQLKEVYKPKETKKK